MAITTVFWDLDGTLIKSESIQDEAIVYATNKLGRKISLSDIPKDVGMDNQVLFRYLFGVNGSLDKNKEYLQWFKTAVDYVLNNLPKVVAVNQSLELVNEFARRGLSQSIVSNSDSKVIHDCVNSLEISKYMRYLIGRDCVMYGKP